MMKRMIDVMVALTLLIAGSLLFLLIYGLIRWKIGTPVVFRQTAWSVWQGFYAL